MMKIVAFPFVILVLLLTAAAAQTPSSLGRTNPTSWCRNDTTFQFNQTICGGVQSSLFSSNVPSWCVVHNPYSSIPFPLFRQGNYFENLTTSCASDGMKSADGMKECNFIQSVSAATVGQGESQGTYVIAGDSDDHFLTFDLQESDADLINMEKVEDFQGLVPKGDFHTLEFLSLPHSKQFMFSKSCFASAACGNLNETNIFTCASDSFLCEISPDYPDDVYQMDDALLFVLPIPKRKDSDLEAPATMGAVYPYLPNFIPNKRFILWRIFTRNETIANWTTYNRNLDGQMAYFAWEFNFIDTEPEEVNTFTVKHAFHHLESNESRFNVTREFYRSERVLVAVYTHRQVLVFQFPLNQTFWHNTTINVRGAVGQKETFEFYRAPAGRRIKAVEFVSEHYNRVYNNETSRYVSPSCMMLLSIAECDDHSENCDFFVLGMPEFRQFDPFDPRYMEDEGTLLNPVLREAGWATCSFPDQWMSKPNAVEEAGCRDRVLLSFPLDTVPTRIVTRYLDPPPMPDVTNSSECPSFPIPWENDLPISPLLRAAQSYTKKNLKAVGDSLSPMDLLGLGGMQYAVDNFFRTMIFIADGTQRILIFGTQQKFCTLDDVLLDRVNNMTFMGRVQSFTVSQNGQHLFASIVREEWQVVAVNRLVEICDELASNPGNIFLQNFVRVCQPDDIELIPREMDISSFAQYVSMCPPGTSCPSMSDPIINLVDSGSYTDRALFMSPCDPGYFCPSPWGVRVKCPIGMQCPFSNMTTPIPCDDDPERSSTCFGEGHLVPSECPIGSVCVAPYFFPIPVPPGKWQVDVGSRASFRNCSPGDWCGLGRGDIDASTFPSSIEALKCPENTVCENPSVMEPTACYCNGDQDQGDVYCEYCPAGTFDTNNICPVGSYCGPPNKKTDCVKSQYCAPGSVSPIVCDRGFYCPSPLEKYECPAGRYCPAGSVDPVRCPFLAHCPRGQGSPDREFLWIGILVIVLLLMCICFNCYTRCRNSQRKRRERKRKSLAEKLGALEASGVSEIDADVEDGRRDGMDASLLAGYSGGGDGDILDLMNDHVLHGSSEPGDRREMETLYHEVDDDVLEEGVPGNVAILPEAKADPAVVDGASKESGPSSQRASIHFRFDELGLILKGKSKKVLLQGINGEIRPGRVTAIMGPSGSGKTTLLNVLCGKARSYAKTVGRICINDRKVRSVERYRRIFGFVPQEDVMHRELTVKEIIRFCAFTRLPSRMSLTQKRRQSQSTIRLLGLNEVRHNRIGDEAKRGVSGGQRKRVNIGMELVSDPAFLALDEPTSGLDATSSQEVIGLCQTIAHEMGMTVVMVIHQPRFEIFEMFDDLILLGKGGRLAYFGPALEASGYFESLGFPEPKNSNPADFVIDVVCGSIAHPEGRIGPPELFSLWDERSRVERRVRGSSLALSSLWDDTSSTSSDVSFSDSEFEMDMEMPKDDGEGTHNALIPTDSVHFKPYGSPDVGMGPPGVISDGPEWPGVSTITADDPEVPVVPIGPQKEKGRRRRKRMARVPHRHTPHFPMQFWLFFLRGIVQQTRDVPAFLFDILLVLVPAICIGLVFHKAHYEGAMPSQIAETCPSAFRDTICRMPQKDPIATFVSLSNLAIGLTGMTSALRTFGNERVVYWRECATGCTRTSAYFVGKNFAALPVIFVAPFVYTAIFYSLVEPRASIFAYYLVFFLVELVASGFGYIVSVLFKGSVSTLVATIITLLSTMFCGSLPTLKELNDMFWPIYWLPWFSFLRYSQEALYLFEIREYRNAFDVEVSLDLFDFEYGDLWWCLLVLVFLTFFLRFLGYLLMILKDKKKKQ